MTTRNSNFIRLYVVFLMFTMVFAAGSSFADVTSGQQYTSCQCLLYNLR